MGQDLKRVKEGVLIELTEERQIKDLPPVKAVIIGESEGWAEVRHVRTLDGREGMMAIKPNGDWWWVAYPFEPENDGEDGG